MREFPGRGGLMYLFSDQHLFIDVNLPKDVSQQLLSPRFNASAPTPQPSRYRGSLTCNFFRIYKTNFY